MKYLILAFALASPAPAAADTVLRLSETAHVMVHPDQLTASLRAEANAPNPTEAQAAVNGAIAEALRQAKADSGVTAATGYYQVFAVAKPGSGWRAAQSLDLTATDGAAMLRLIGALQGKGLALERLEWVVAPPTARAAQSEATRQALSRLKARAEEAAGILGLRFGSFREVRLDGARPPPMPGPRVFSMAAAPAPPPSAEAQDVDIQASVEGEALLLANP